MGSNEIIGTYRTTVVYVKTKNGQWRDLLFQTTKEQQLGQVIHGGRENGGRSGGAVEGGQVVGWLATHLGVRAPGFLKACPEFSSKPEHHRSSIALSEDTQTLAAKPNSASNDKSDATWGNYIAWCGLEQLDEVVSLDPILCPTVLPETKPEYWNRIVNEDFMLHYY